MRGVRAPLWRILELGGEEGANFVGKSGEGELDRGVIGSGGLDDPLVAAIEGEDGGSGDLVK